MTLQYIRVPRYDELVAAGELPDQGKLNRDWWPLFMQEDNLANAIWRSYYQHYAHLQTVVVEDQRAIAQIQCIPVVWDGDPVTLPDAGWRWALQTGVKIAEDSIPPDTMCAIAIAMDKSVRGRGLSGEFISVMADVARGEGLTRFIAPVRPSLKDHYPLISIEDYIQWQREDGLPFDPWLRVHVRAGATIERVTHRSMEVHATRADWETWTDLKFMASGEYVVPSALNPVIADLDADQVSYIEPNVWMVHQL